MDAIPSMATQPEIAGYVGAFAAACLWMLFIVGLTVARTIDLSHQHIYRTHVCCHHYNPVDQFQFLIDIKTSSIPLSGMTSRAWIVLIGEYRTSAEMLLDNSYHYIPSAQYWFLASTALNLGNIQGIILRMDDTGLDRDWRINSVQVYSLNQDILNTFRPTKRFTPQKPSQIIFGTPSPKKLSFSSVMKSQFGTSLSDNHILLSFLLNVTGSTRRVYQVARLFCTSLWCYVVALVLHVGLPTHRLEDVRFHVQFGLHLVTGLIVCALNVVFIYMVSCLEGISCWSLRPPKATLPEPNINAEKEQSTLVSVVDTDEQIIEQPRDRTYSELLNDVVKNARTTLQFHLRPPGHDIRDTGSNIDGGSRLGTVVTTVSQIEIKVKKSKPKFKSTKKEGNIRYERTKREPQFQIWQDLILNATRTDTDGPSRKLYSYNSLMLMRHSINSVVQCRDGEVLLKTDKNDRARESVDILDLDMGIIGRRPIHLMFERLTRPEWRKEALITEDLVHWEGIYTYPKRDDVQKLSAHHENENSQKQQGVPQKIIRQSHKSFLIHNFLQLVFVLNICMCTGIIVLASLYQRPNQLLLTGIHAFALLVTEIVLMEPVLFLLYAIVLALRRNKKFHLKEQRTRANDARKVLSLRSTLQELNYIKRESYNPSWMYQGMGHPARLHTYFALKECLEHSKRLASHDQKFKGTASLLLFIICAVVVMYQHTNIQTSFMQKRMIYEALGLTDEYVKQAVEVSEIWHFLNNVYLPFTHKVTIEGQPAFTEIEIYSKIRQVRVRPDVDKQHTEYCELESYPKLNKYMKEPCFILMNGYSLETRNFTGDWKVPLNSNESEEMDNPEQTRFYRTTVQTLYEILLRFQSRYSFDGYQYVFRESHEDNWDTLRNMEQSKWIDRYTRAILIDASIVNINTGIASTLVITYHFKPNGIELTYNIKTFVFDFRKANYIVLIIALVVLSLVALNDVFKFISQLTTFGPKFLKKRQHVIEFTTTVFVLFLLGGFILRFYLTELKHKAFIRRVIGTEGPLYIPLKDLGLVVDILNTLSGFMAFAALIRIFEAATNFERLYIMLKMIEEVFVLFIAPASAIFAMSFFFYLKFHTDALQMSTMPMTYMTCMQFIISKRNLGIEDNNLRHITKVVLWLVFFMVITNGFVVALNDSYSVQMIMSKKKRKGKVARSILLEMLDMIIASLGIRDVVGEDLEETTKEEDHSKDGKVDDSAVREKEENDAWLQYKGMTKDKSFQNYMHAMNTGW